jgi:uncharacterized protein YbjT (DUF2867 family)
MTTPILITGGTGTLGRLIVPRLQQAGRPVRVLSRHSHESEDGVEYVTGDLTNNAGLERAVAGVETIVHLAGTAKGDEVKTRNLVRVAARVGTPHLVYISVVGAERVPVASGLDRAAFGYFASKRAAEQEIANSGLPWTTLRATQFYQSLLMVARQMAKLPVIPVPSGFRFQPVDADEVAAQLAELALGTPSGLVPDLAGPRAYGMADLIREYLRTNHRHRLFLPIKFPGKAARAIRAGANLAPAPPTAQRTWEDFLTEQLH